MARVRARRVNAQYSSIATLWHILKSCCPSVSTTSVGIEALGFTFRYASDSWSSSFTGLALVAGEGEDGMGWDVGGRTVDVVRDVSEVFEVESYAYAGGAAGCVECVEVVCNFWVLGGRHCCGCCDGRG